MCTGEMCPYSSWASSMSREDQCGEEESRGGESGDASAKNPCLLTSGKLNLVKNANSADAMHDVGGEFPRGQ